MDLPWLEGVDVPHLLAVLPNGLSFVSQVFMTRRPGMVWR